MVPGNNFFDGYFPFRKLPTCKNVQITEITSSLPILGQYLLSQVTPAIQEKGLDFILKCLSQIFGSELVCAFFRDTNS